MPEPVGTSAGRAKLRVAAAVVRTPWPRLARAVERRAAAIRVFNYHGTPARFAVNLERQLRWIADRYEILPAAKLEQALAGGEGRGPTAFLTFDDGLASNATVAAPLLEQYGMTAIFAVIAGFPDVAPDRQPEWFRSHVRTAADAEHAGRDDLRAIGWAELGEIAARGHRICCHTETHVRITGSTPPSILADEIEGAREHIEREVRAPVDGFCWPVAVPRRADTAAAMVRHAFRYALCDGPRPLLPPHDPFRIYRTNVEASWPLETLELQSSGLIDLRFAARTAWSTVRQGGAS